MDDRVIAEEKRSTFIAAGDRAVGSVTEKKTFRADVEAEHDMPLPTDAKTVFLGGLFGLAVMLVLLAFGGTLSMLAGPAAAWAAKLPQAIPKLRDTLGILKAPINAVQDMLHQLAARIGGQGAAMPQRASARPWNCRCISSAMFRPIC